MFSAFSSNFWGMALAHGYRLDYWLGTTGGPSFDEVDCDAAYMAFQKVDIATLICVHVVDATGRDWRDVLKKDPDHIKWAQGLLDRLQNVSIIYLIAGHGQAPWQDEQFVEYHGQEAYSVFWWLDFNTGEVTVPKGQPTQLFGLRALIEKSRIEATKSPEVTGSPQNQADVRGLPFPKSTVTPRPWTPATVVAKHRIPFLTYGLIGVNVVILILMYIAGFPEDMWVPARFGAIVPNYIFEYGEWFRLFTAMFVHFGVAHLFANLTGLLVFGTRVERYFGRMAFCVTYVFSGLMGSLFSLYFTTGYAAGASGALYGLIGAIFAYTRITGKAIELMNWYILFLFIGIGIAMGFMAPQGVDNFGHLGGLIGGLIVGTAMVWIMKLKGRA